MAERGQHRHAEGRKGEADMAIEMLPPLNDAIIIAVAQLVADDPVSRRDPDARPRDPSHQVITDCIRRTGLETAEAPKPAGKEKRVRAVLNRALDHDPVAGRRFVAVLR